eukprot:TRINITY_DN5023_c0_g2_i1.p1 TRINITY_DN5023_c0_g2~~TRINITY_DN5023_c0_g2_i1.p1  ORF type:complete len:197 (-),score=36.96 TRINITY_DN5023_c0_g2_i1:181-771(-)
MAATENGAPTNSPNNLTQVGNVAMDAARTSMKFVRSASIKIKEKMDEAGVTEYSQQMAAKLMNEGVPTISQKLKELLDLVWRKFVDFLDSKGLKEPLEQFFIRFRDMPIVKTVWNMLQQMFTMMWKMVVNLRNSSSGQKQETVGDSSVSANILLSQVDGTYSMNEEVPTIRTPTPTDGQPIEDYGSGTEGRATPEH